MTHSFLGLSRRNIALIALAAAIGASLCSTSAGSGASPLSHHAARKPLQSSWNYLTVDSPYGSNTEVTGINNLTGSNGPEIVGYYVSSTIGTNVYYSSFYASAPYSTTNFSDASYPRTKAPQGPEGTQMNAINSQASASAYPVLAGIVYEPGDQGGNWAVVDDQGLWSLIKDPGKKTSNGGGIAAYLYGINDQDIVVGYHTTETSTSPVAYFVAPPELRTDIVFPSSFGTVQSSIAYGINDSGGMVGTATVPNTAHTGTVTESWYALCLSSSSCPTSGSGSGFSPSSYCFAVLSHGTNTYTTTAYAISDVYTVGVGIQTYLVAGSFTGSGGVTHGFVVPISITGSGTSAKCTVGTFETVNEKNADNLTVVRGVNNQGYIAGYYNSGSGALHGFIGTPTSSARRHR